MTHAATLREMIARQETELAALREALEIIEAVDAQCGEGVGTLHTPVAGSAPSNVQEPHIAPTPGLYGEDGRTVASTALADLPASCRLALEAIRIFGPRATEVDIARYAGIAVGHVSNTVQKLKHAGVLDTTGHARGRRFVLLDGSGFGPQASAPSEPVQQNPSRNRLIDRNAALAEQSNQAVLAAIRELGGGLSVEQMAAHTGLSKWSLKAVLQRMKGLGLIDMEGWGVARRYIIVGERAPDQPRPAVEKKPAPLKRPVVGPTVTRDPQPPKPQPVARPPAPYVPTRTDGDRRAEEQAQIDAFLASGKARRFGPGLLVTLLEQAFAEEGVEFEPVHSLKENQHGRMPYRVAGKLVTAEAAIKRADVIRRRMGLPPIAAEAGEVAA